MKIIIPARLHSGRVHRKLLQDVGGLTVIERTVAAAQIAAKELDAELMVATDATEIKNLLAGQGVRTFTQGQYITEYAPENGTERVALLAQALNIPLSEPILNIQGDKCGVVPDAIVELGEELLMRGSRDVSQRHRTLYCLCEELRQDDHDDPGTVKVVTTSDGMALYFTRSYVKQARKHCGIYGYYASFLHQYLNNMPLRGLERNESLEQMRALENGSRVCCPMLRRNVTSGIAINVPADLDKARRLTPEYHANGCS